MHTTFFVRRVATKQKLFKSHRRIIHTHQTCPLPKMLVLHVRESIGFLGKLEPKTPTRQRIGGDVWVSATAAAAATSWPGYWSNAGEGKGRTRVGRGPFLRSLPFKRGCYVYITTVWRAFIDKNEKFPFTLGGGDTMRAHAQYIFTTFTPPQPW